MNGSMAAASRAGVPGPVPASASTETSPPHWNAAVGGESIISMRPQQPDLGIRGIVTAYWWQHPERAASLLNWRSAHLRRVRDAEGILDMS